MAIQITEVRVENEEENARLTVSRWSDGKLHLMVQEYDADYVNSIVIDPADLQAIAQQFASQ